jgi:peptidoglycan biosynthesis protein MviN/MurJ (putative lipid II flippase)
MIFHKRTTIQTGIIWLVLSSILIKTIGVLREALIAFSIGNTIDFARFNTFRVITDFIIIFGLSVPTLEGIFLPLYAKISKENRNLSFYKVLSFMNRLAIFAVLILLIVFITVNFLFKNKFNANFFYICLLFSTYLFLSVSNATLFTLLKVKGLFVNYSKQAFFNTIVTFLLLLLLVNTFNEKSLIISSIIGLIVSDYFLKKLIYLKKDVKSVIEPNLNEFKWQNLIAINHVTFIGFSGKLLIGFSNNNSINIYHYSFTIVYSIVLIFVSNISTITLFNSTIKHSKKILITTIIKTFALLIPVGILFFLKGDIIIKLIYEHGKFTKVDSSSTFNFLKKLLLPFGLVSITQIAMQPLLVVESYYSNLFKKQLAHIVVIITAIFFSIGFITSKFEIIVWYYLYFVSIIIFLYLLYFYWKFENIIFTKN